METPVRSCIKNCIHFKVCKFRPDPYMGSSSGGYRPTVGYEKYRDQLLEFKAKYCEDYFLKEETKNV